MKMKEALNLSLTILIVAAATATGITAAVKEGAGPDVPVVPVPPGHHESDDDYQWKIVVDENDEGWVFFTDTEPTFSLQQGENGNAQTVVCIENFRHQNPGAIDDLYTGKRCVGGEGKIDINEQGSKVRK